MSADPSTTLPEWWGSAANLAPNDGDGWSMAFGGNSALLTRKNIAERAGLQFGGDRDLYETLGYTRNPTVRDYWSMYLRNPLGRVIVNAPAATTWRQIPAVNDDAETDDETEFEDEVGKLFRRKRAMHYLERADKVAGIGEYGVIVLGFADTDDMSDPVDTDSLDGLDDLNYIATYSQDRVTDIDVEDDPTSERYGLPTSYDIQFEVTDGFVDSGRSNTVHWTRVIHVAENLLEDEVYGRPRLEAVFNALYDVEKVLGGAAEMTWRGAGLRLQLDIDTDGKVTDAEDMAEQAEEMIHGLRSVLRTKKTDMNVIEGQTVDPSGITGELLKLIAGETGIPQRILTGSERGELASTQDRATFYGRISERQETFAEPQMLRPFLDRLVRVGVLPTPTGGSGEYEVEWPDLFELNELEQAEVMAEMAQALKNAAPMGDPGQVATAEEVRQEILGWSPERGSEVGDSVETVEDTIDDLPETDDDRDAFDQIQDIVADLPDAEGRPAVTDGGEGR